MCIYLVVDVNSRLVISSAISHIMCFKLNVCLLVGYFTQFIHITSYQERFATAEDIVWWRDKNEKIGSWDHKAWITKGPKWKVRLRISWLQYLHRWPTERACCVSNLFSIAVNQKTLVSMKQGFQAPIVVLLSLTMYVTMQCRAECARNTLCEGSYHRPSYRRAKSYPKMPRKTNIPGQVYNRYWRLQYQRITSRADECRGSIFNSGTGILYNTDNSAFIC